jgi:hypothetical protein
MGRRQFRGDLQHGREILRRFTESDTYANSFSNPNRDRYADRDCNGDSNTHGYGETYTNPEDRSHVKSSADARASTLEVPPDASCCEWRYGPEANATSG